MAQRVSGHPDCQGGRRSSYITGSERGCDLPGFHNGLGESLQNPSSWPGTLPTSRQILDAKRL